MDGVVVGGMGSDRRAVMPRAGSHATVKTSPGAWAMEVAGARVIHP